LSEQNLKKGLEFTRKVKTRMKKEDTRNITSKEDKNKKRRKTIC